MTENLLKTDGCKTTIYLESEFDQVARSIRKFQKESLLEFDTIFKLYKLQNYPLEPRVFKGSRYKYGTLSCIKNKVKIATNDNTNLLGDTTYNVIRDFIKEIQVCSKPYDYIFNKSRRTVQDLIKSNKLKKEDIEFIKSNIMQTRKPACSDEERNTPGITLERKRSKEIMKRLSENKVLKNNKPAGKNTQEIFEVIASNYQKGFNYVKEQLGNLTNLKDKTLQNYLYMCNAVVKGKNVTGMPSGLMQQLNKHNSKISLPITSKVGSKTIAKKNISSDKYVLIDGDNILKTSTDLSFLKGYSEGYSTSGNKSKIYKITELVES